MPIIVDHRRDTGGGAGELNVYALVLERLLFLVDDEATSGTNSTHISVLTLETMLWLNVCLRLDQADVGLETNYTQLQLSLIADLVAYHVLLYRAIAMGAGIDGYTIKASSSTSVSPNGLYIKKGRSDDTEVEWDLIDTKENSIHGGINISEIMAKLFNDMCDKIQLYQCRICRCADCSLKLEFIDDGIVLPFQIIGC